MTVADVRSARKQNAATVFHGKAGPSLILSTPDEHEMLALLNRVERRRIHNFLRNVVCARSPYDPLLPFGIATFKGSSLTLVDASQLLERIIGPAARSSLHAVKELRQFDFTTLISAMTEFLPNTVEEANQFLNTAGKARLNAFSLCQLYRQSASFDAYVRALEDRAISGPHRQFASLALVAMRGSKWLVLSGEIYRAIITSFVTPGTAHAHFAEWDENLLSYAGSAVEATYHSLFLKARTSRKQKIHQTKALLAVLCTDLNDVSDLTWKLAEQILRKSNAPGQSADPTSALRNHWRRICRKNQSKGSVEGGMSLPQTEADVSVSASRSSWDSSEIATQSVTCETYHSPTDPTFRVMFNTGRDPFLLSDVSPDEARAVLLDVESAYVADFWDSLSEPSPHESSMPYALRGSKRHHTILSPAKLYASISGHCDLNNPESVEALKEYSFAELAGGIRALRPATVLDANALLTEYGRARLRAVPVACEVDLHSTFGDLLKTLTGRAISSGFHTHKSIAQHALIAFRNAHWVILPQSVVAHIGTVVRKLHSFELRALADPLFLLTGDLRDLYSELSRESRQPDAPLKWTFARKATIAVLCTNVRGLADFSMPLAERILSLKGRAIGGVSSREPARARSLWQTVCEKNGPSAMLPPLSVNCHRDRLSGLVPNDARFDHWIDLLADFIQQQPESGNLEPYYTAFGHWLTFLGTLDVLPHPTEVQRCHIWDKHGPCFRVFLEEHEATAHHRNMCLSKLDKVFEDLVSTQAEIGRTFVNPIRYKHDRFKARRFERPTSTVRSRLPSLVLDEFRKSLVVQLPSGGFEWGKVLLDVKGIFDVHAGGMRLMCPILPAIIYLMLTYPLRGHHARWLDSSEMDEYYFDFNIGIFQHNLKAGIAGRQSGVIQCDNVAAPGPPASLAFRVAVNKRTLDERMRSSYEIPFVPPDVLWVIKQVMDWQKLYGPLPHLVKEVHEPIRRAKRNQKMEVFYPDICPLFRYRKQKSFYPPSPMQLAHFWGNLCAAWDRVNASWKNPQTGATQQRPGVPILSREYRRTSQSGHVNIWHVARFDLHSMRVGGVSYLLDKGMPLAFVSQIAGHRSLAMTAYYYKSEAAAIRIALQDAWKDGRCDPRVQELIKLVQDVGNESWMIGTADGIAKLKRSRETGMFTLTLSGICPGASCSTGLLENESDVKGSPVPGSRCPLCRYFVYGPPFRNGLIYDANCLLRSLHRQANRQFEIRQALTEAEDRGDTTEAFRLRGEDDRLDQEASLDIRELFNLHRMIEECLEREFSGSRDTSDLIQLMTHTDSHVQVVVESISEFSQLKSIVEFSQLLHPSRHVEAEIAALEFKDLILTLLRRNGAACYFAGLPKEESTHAALQLGRIVEKMVPEEDNLDKLFKGAIALRDLPSLEAAVMEQASLGMTGSLELPPSAKGVSVECN